MDSRTFRLNEPQVVADTVDEEVLAINMATGAYFNLKGWSAYVWALLTSGTSVADTHRQLACVADATTAASGPDEAIAASLVTSFVEELVGHGLLEPAGEPGTDPGHPANPSPLPTPPAVPFDGLAVEAHTDMADLILLDPVHDVDAEHGWPTPPPS